MSQPVPEAVCISCRRAVPCVRVSSGTVYKPTVWEYPDPDKPLEGICTRCQIDLAAHAMADAIFPVDPPDA